MKLLETRARRIGWCFVLATVAGVGSVMVTSSTLDDDDVLSAVAADPGTLIVGALLIFVMLIAMIGTAVLLAPVLRADDEDLALSYVLARTLEVTVIAVGTIATLLLVPLSWSVTGGTVDSSSADAVADTLRAASDWTGYLGAQMIFSVSALILNWVFLRSGMMPRWLALWGLVGVPLMFLSGLLPMFESLDSNVAVNLLVVPLAVQEMVMAVWMIAKGFSETLPGRTAEAPSVESAAIRRS